VAPVYWWRRGRGRVGAITLPSAALALRWLSSVRRLADITGVAPASGATIRYFVDDLPITPPLCGLTEWYADTREWFTHTGAAWTAEVRSAAGALTGTYALGTADVGRWASDAQVTSEPSGAASGTVNVVVHFRRQDGVTPGNLISRAWIEARLINFVYAVTVANGERDETLAIDTTTLRDGTHELFAVGITDEPIATHPLGLTNSQQFWSYARTTLTTSNGATLRALRSASHHLALYVTAGVPTALAIATETCAGTVTTLADQTLPSYVSAHPAVATVNAAGVVTPVAPGYTEITVTYGGRTLVVPVYVRQTAAEFAHFGRDAALHTTYAAGDSKVMRSLFWLGLGEFGAADGATEHQIGRWMRDAHINALEDGVLDLTTATDYASCVTQVDAKVTALNGIRDRQGLDAMLVADGVFRRRQDFYLFLNNTWAQDGLVYALEQLKKDGVYAIDALDETDLFLGDDPFPTDGRWDVGGSNYIAPYPMPDTAITDALAIINSAAQRPPMGWPPVGSTAIPPAANWMGVTGPSDYVVHYTNLEPGDDARQWWDGASVRQFTRGYDAHMDLRHRNAVPSYRAISGTVGTVGPLATKLGPGVVYTPGQDEPTAVGNDRAGGCAASVWHALAKGMSAFRLYAWEYQQANALRRIAGVGSGSEEGVHPRGSGPSRRWCQMAAALTPIDMVEATLLGPRTSPPSFGEDVSCGARAGLLWCTNLTETWTLPLVFTTIAGWLDGAIRHRIRDMQTDAEWAGTQAHTHQLQPGETVVYELVATADARPAIAWARPYTPMVVAGNVPLRVTASGPKAPVSVEFFLDGTSIGLGTAAGSDWSRTLTRAEWLARADASVGDWIAIKAIATAADASTCEIRTAVCFAYDTTTASPVADAGGPYTEEPDVALTLDATDSTGDDLTYMWEGFPDGTLIDGGAGEGAATSTGAASPAVVFPEVGTFPLTLTVADERGRQDTAEVTVTIAATVEPPLPSLPITANLVVWSLASNGVERDSENRVLSWINQVAPSGARWLPDADPNNALVRTVDATTGRRVLATQGTGSHLDLTGTWTIGTVVIVAKHTGATFNTWECLMSLQGVGGATKYPLYGWSADDRWIDNADTFDTFWVDGVAPSPNDYDIPNLGTHQVYAARRTAGAWTGTGPLHLSYEPGFPTVRSFQGYIEEVLVFSDVKSDVDLSLIVADVMARRPA
jgi:hypothetical protein